MNQYGFKRTGETATTGAVRQHWGPRPIGLCSCGQRVVSLQNEEGRWFVANCFPYRSGNGYYYIGARIHNCFFTQNRK